MSQFNAQILSCLGPVKIYTLPDIHLFVGCKILEAGFLCTEMPAKSLPSPANDIPRAATASEELLLL